SSEFDPRPGYWCKPNFVNHEKQNPRPVSQTNGETRTGHPVREVSCFRKLGAHLFHELAHRCDVAWRAAFDPFLITLCSFFQVGAERVLSVAVEISRLHSSYERGCQEKMLLHSSP